MKTIIFYTFISAFFLACGELKEETIKDYRVWIAADNPDVKAEVESLIHFFNYKSCFETLRLVHNEDDANSYVNLVKNMKDRKGRIGEGQYVIETDEKTSSDPTVSTRHIRNHSMNIWFDTDYFMSRMNSDNAEHRYDLEKLAFHEIGHGLEMGHSANQNDIMFESTTGKKNDIPFFMRVRKYFDQPETCSQD